MQGTGVRKSRLVLHIWLLQPFCAITPIAVSRGLAKVGNLVKYQSSPGADFYFFDRLVLGGNHSADCQSAASQIDPISFYFADDDLWGYLSCAPAEVPPPAFVWFETLDSSDHEKND